MNLLFAVLIAVAGMSGCVTRSSVKKMIDESSVEQQDLSKYATLDDLKKEEADCKKRGRYHVKTYHKSKPDLGPTLDQQLSDELKWMK